LNKWRVALLTALGGKCTRCGEGDLRKLEIHDISGEHAGYGNKQRLKDIRDYRLTGKIPYGRYLLCWKCHRLWVHGSAYSRVKLQIEKELEEMKNEEE
jgi:hypothetical protein